MEERNAWAEERTLLAHERTFAAWTRTALTAIAVGLAAGELLAGLRPHGVAAVVKVLMLGTGMGLQVLGFWTYWQTFRRLRRRRGHAPPMWPVLTLSAVVVLSALGALVLTAL